MARKTQTVVPPSAVLAPLSAELQERYRRYTELDAAAVTRPGWAFLGTRGGIFRAGDEVLPSRLRVVIMGAVRENNYYEDEYDPEVLVPPTCFAVGGVGRGDDGLAPPADLQARAASACAACPQNVFGSDAGRSGKACKNVVRLALLPADDLHPDRLKRAVGARLRVPVTSVRLFNAYASMLTRGQIRPLFTVVTDVVIEPDADNVFSIRFEPVAAIEDVFALNVLESRLDEVKIALEEHPTLDVVTAGAPTTLKVKRKPSSQARKQARMREQMSRRRGSEERRGR